MSGKEGGGKEFSEESGLGRGRCHRPWYGCWIYINSDLKSLESFVLGNDIM